MHDIHKTAKELQVETLDTVREAVEYCTSGDITYAKMDGLKDAWAVLDHMANAMKATGMHMAPGSPMRVHKPE